MSAARDNLEPGRHAHPVDQADAVLWAADLRMRALMLVEGQQLMMVEPGRMTMPAVAGWMDAAWRVLREIAAAS